MHLEIISTFRASGGIEWHWLKFNACPALNFITTTLDASLAQSS
jgi:hypothetical protein